MARHEANLRGTLPDLIEALEDLRAEAPSEAAFYNTLMAFLARRASAEHGDASARDLLEAQQKGAATDVLMLSVHDARNYLATTEANLADVERLLPKVISERDPTRRSWRVADLLDAVDIGIEASIEARDLLAHAATVGAATHTSFDTPVLVLVQGALRLLRRPRNVSLGRRTVDANVRAAAPPSEVTRVLINLLRNAIEAVADDAAGRVHLSSWATPSTVFIEVVDNGPGIPAEQLETVFEPWNSSRSRGSGLGLHICRVLSAGWGGTLEVNSVPGEVTQFICSIPRSPGR